MNLFELKKLQQKIHFSTELVTRFKISYLSLRMTALKDSLVCNAHLQTYSTKHLPYGKHLELNMNDIVKWNGIIEKHFSETELSKISRLSQSFYICTKGYDTRNFAGLCHSVVHSSSLGNGIACINLAKIIGLKYKRTDLFILQISLSVSLVL